MSRRLLDLPWEDAQKQVDEAIKDDSRWRDFLSGIKGINLDTLDFYREEAKKGDGNYLALLAGLSNRLNSEEYPSLLD